MKIFEGIKKKVQRAQELTKFLQDPEVTKNPGLYQKYARELSSLTPVVNKYKELESVEEHLQDAQSLLESKDKQMQELAKHEIEGLEKKRDALCKQLEELLVEEDPDAIRSCVVEIRAGTGGLEATIFSADLFRMYSRYASKQGWKIEVLSSNPTEANGFKEIIFAIEGKGAYGKLRFESGVHRVQRVPATEASGRIHTSASSVVVMPEAEDIDVNIEPKDLRIDVFRATGPGGQGVNTTDSAVRLTHIPTGIVVSCQDERSQIKNKAKAMKVMRTRLLDKAKTDQIQKQAQERKAMIGTGDRSQKIRTYNFPDRRITDHRIGLTLHKIEQILQGDLDEFILALTEENKKLLLKKLSQ